MKTPLKNHIATAHTHSDAEPTVDEIQASFFSVMIATNAYSLSVLILEIVGNQVPDAPVSKQVKRTHYRTM